MCRSTKPSNDAITGSLVGAVLYEVASEGRGNKGWLPLRLDALAHKGADRQLVSSVPRCYVRAVLRCVECGRQARNGDEAIGWRAYITVDAADDDEEPEVAALLPGLRTAGVPLLPELECRSGSAQETSTGAAICQARD